MTAVGMRLLVATAAIVAAKLAAATSVAAQSAASCVGDCNEDYVVTVNELVTGVNILLDRAAIAECPPFVCHPNIDVLIDCGVIAVRNALSGCPTRTPTPTILATRTPTPAASVVYELAEDSTILMRSPSPDSVPIVEPLSGTFVVRVDCGDPVGCVSVKGPNTLFALTITSIAFQSAHVTVGGTGSIDALTFDVGHALLGGTLLIADEAILAYGQGTFDSHRFPPSFTPLELCGQEGAKYAISCDAIRDGIESGYVLTVVAAPRH